MAAGRTPRAAATPVTARHPRLRRAKPRKLASRHRARRARGAAVGAELAAARGVPRRQHRALLDGVGQVQVLLVAASRYDVAARRDRCEAEEHEGADQTRPVRTVLPQANDDVAGLQRLFGELQQRDESGAEETTWSTAESQDDTVRDRQTGGREMNLAPRRRHGQRRSHKTARRRYTNR